MIKYTTTIFKRIYDAGVAGEDRKLAILTARGSAVIPSIKQWLQDAVKVDPQQIEIITLGDSDPNKKKEWIEGQILNGYNLLNILLIVGPCFYIHLPLFRFPCIAIYSTSQIFKF